MERAIVCVNVNPPAVERVLKEIKALNEVESVDMVFGAKYDVCFQVKEESLDRLKRVLSEKISRISNIRSTMVLFEQASE